MPEALPFLPASFHFLRPAWLLAVVPAAALLFAAARSAVKASPWHRLVDAHLLRHLLVVEDGPGRRWPLALLGIGWLAASIAMAGPTWERIPQPTYTAKSPTVVALDLSPSMDVDDLAPSRLARARHKLHDLLERRKGGQVALVLYADDAFVAAPLTDDGRVVEEMIPSLTPGLMPGRGSRPERAIAQASALLDQAGVPGGSIVLLTASPGADAGAALAAARDAAARGRRVSVLGMGTEQGAPARDAAGRMVKNTAGDPVFVAVDRAALESLASAGAGRATLVTADDADLARLDSGSAISESFAERTETAVRADAWRDGGAWLVALPLLLAPLAFRRGWLLGLVAAAVLLGGAPAAHAAGRPWDDLWETRDQQGQAALESGRASDASELFDDPSWKAASQYESGKYPEAGEAYAKLGGAENRYNLGNALARAGDLEQAIASYDEALKEKPGHADATFNRDLVQRLLDEQRKQQKEQERAKEKGQEQEQAGQNQNSQPEPKQAEQDQQNEQPGQRQDDPAEEQARQGESQPEQQTGQQKNDQPQTGGSSQDQPRTGADQAAEPKSDKNATQNAEAKGSGDQPENDQEPGAGPRSNPEAEPGDVPRSNQQAEHDDVLERKLDQALGNTPAGTEPEQETRDEARDDAQAAAGSGSAEPAPTTEHDQAREQKLRQVPDDPGGLLRARIRRHFAEKRLAEQGETTPW